MSSAKGKLARLLGGVLLRRAIIASAEDLGGFRRLVLRGDVPSPKAGSKIQILLPSDDMRTYTPVASNEGIVLLGWKHASGPGARWVSDVRVGAEVRFVGPQRSLEIPPGPVVLVGDETSVAVAASFEAERPGLVTTVLQASSVEQTRGAAVRVGVVGTLAVVGRGDTTAALAAIEAASNTAHAHVAVTGGSELVIALRNALRARGTKRLTTKTYWIPGKQGLD